MLFNSYEFIFIFLPIAFGFFFLIAKFLGNMAAIIWLVFVSFFFYGWWDHRYIPLLLTSICFNYFVGIHIENNEANFTRKLWLVSGVIVNVLLLGIFKYTGFFLETANFIIGRMVFEIPQIILPLGISFFTFTQTAYLVELYRRETKNHSFATYCEFVTIFPHLIAGPIINHREMVSQFASTKNYVINYHNVALGICLFAMGRFQTPKQIQKLAGLALKENSSGKHKGETSISRRGRKRLRTVLFTAAISLIGKNKAYQKLHQHYTQRLKNPLKKKQSVVAIGCKLIRIFFTLLSKGVAYDEEKMLNDIVWEEEAIAA